MKVDSIQEQKQQQSKADSILQKMDHKSLLQSDDLYQVSLTSTGLCAFYINLVEPFTCLPPCTCHVGMANGVNIAVYIGNKRVPS